MGQSTRLGAAFQDGVKTPVVVATTLNIALQGLPLISGVQLVALDRVLVKSQNDKSENGLYVTSPGTWDRTKDFNASNDIIAGQLIIDSNNGNLYSTSFDGDIVVGTTEITFLLVDKVRPTDDLVSVEKKAPESQVLAASQTSVTFARINIKKANLFLTSLGGDRGRIFKGGVDYTEISSTEIELNNSQPAGTICIADESTLQTAIFSASDLVKKFDTIGIAKANINLKNTDVLNLAHRLAGDDGGGIWDVVLAASFPPNEIDIVQATGVATLALKLRVDGEANLVAMGADTNGTIDATDAVKRAVTLISASGGVIKPHKGVFLLSDTITVNTDSVKFIGEGEGTVQGGIATLRASAATRFLYSSAAAALPMFEFTSVASEVPKSGGGMKGIMLDCDDTATTALILSSWRKGVFENLHIYAPTTRGIHTRAFSGTLTSEPYDTQHNEFNNIEVHAKNVVGNTHQSLLMTGGEGAGGTISGNSSFNYFTNCHFTSESNTAVRLENTDNNYFYLCRAGGSASFFSLVLETDEGTTGNARFNQFHGCEFTGKGVNAKAGQSGGLSSFDNYFFGLSRSNGAPKPTVGKGAGGSADASIIVDGVAEFDFIPTVEGTSTAGTATYATQVGRVTRDADRVQFELKVGFSSFTGTGDLIIQGLPFAHDAVVAVGVFSVISENLTFSNQLAARMISNTGTIELVTIATGAVAVNVPVDSAAILEISGSYMTQDN